MQVLKVGVPKAGDEHSLPHRNSDSVRSGFARSLQIVGCHARVGFRARLCLSLSYLPGHVLMWRSCSDNFQVIFRVNCTLSSCRLSVSLGGSELKLFLFCHLNCLPGLIFHNWKSGKSRNLDAFAHPQPSIPEPAPSLLPSTTSGNHQSVFNIQELLVCFCFFF